MYTYLIIVLLNGTILTSVMESPEMCVAIAAKATATLDVRTIKCVYTEKLHAGKV